MQSINWRPVFLLMIMIAATAFATRNKPGGEGFDIYLNNKLVLQRYGSLIQQPGELDLHQAKSTDLLRVGYYHCGQPAKARILQVKDANGILLRTFSYGDAKTAEATMLIPIKDLLDLTSKSGALQLVYCSGMQHPPRMLANFHL